MANALRILSARDPDYQIVLGAFARRVSEFPEAAERAARTIIQDVRARGDAAVRELTERFEQRRLDTLELSPAEWDRQIASVAAPVLRALERAAARVRGVPRARAGSRCPIVQLRGGRGSPRLAGGRRSNAWACTCLAAPPAIPRPS